MLYLCFTEETEINLNQQNNKSPSVECTLNDRMLLHGKFAPYKHFGQMYKSIGLNSAHPNTLVRLSKMEKLTQISGRFLLNKGHNTDVTSALEIDAKSRRVSL